MTKKRDGKGGREAERIWQGREGRQRGKDVEERGREAEGEK